MNSLYLENSTTNSANFFLIFIYSHTANTILVDLAAHCQAGFAIIPISSLSLPKSLVLGDKSSSLSANGKISLQPDPGNLTNETVFLNVDDTTVPKLAKSLPPLLCCMTILPYKHVNGHCFVSLTLSIPPYPHVKKKFYSYATWQFSGGACSKDFLGAEYLSDSSSKWH